MSAGRVAALATEIDRTRRQLYARLRSADAPALWRRPVPDRWSVIENVRHLIFAEQAHLGHLLPDASAWSPQRLTSRGKEFRAAGGVVVLRYRERQLVAEYAGTEPLGDVEDVLRSWTLVHRPIRQALRAAGAEAALERHLAHLCRHVEVIERQLGRARGPGGR